jgi:quinol monooxygenase YgiN
MFTRVVEIKAKSGKARELGQAINDKALPILKKQDGFVDEIVLVSDTEPDRFLALSFWKRQQDAERYNKEQYPKVNELISHLLGGAPTVKTFNVDTSTTNRIAAGKAA